VDTKPEPIVLVNQATGNIAAFACGKCHVVASSPKGFIGTQDECITAARAAALEHCGPWFCECGAERRQHFTVCDRCRCARQAEEADDAERARFDAAEKVAAKDWDGEYVWSDRFQEIFGDVDELLGRYEDEDEEPPLYVWECERVDFGMDADDVLGRIIETDDHWPGVSKYIGDADRQELQALLDGWLKKRDIHWWRAAHRRAVVLREEE
jgi:hypothetical protein